MKASSFISALVICIINSHVLALNIDPGFDLFETVPGSVIFDPFGTGLIQLEGVPLGGSLGNTDTIIQRHTALPSGSSGPIQIELVALQLKSVDPVDIGGTLFDVDVVSGSLLGEPSNSIGSSSIDHSFDPAGGTLSQNLNANLRLTYTEVGNPTNTIELVESEVLGGNGVWSHTPLPDQLIDPVFPSGGFFSGVDPFGPPGSVSGIGLNGGFTFLVLNPVTAADADGDGVPDSIDNAPDDANPDQADQDGDGIGDVADPDVDGDGVDNALDNAPTVPNPGQEDNDSDGQGDVIDLDDDNDGVLDGDDNSPLDANPDQADTDNDGEGDASDPDDDGDGLADGADNNPLVANELVADAGGPYSINQGDTLNLDGLGSFGDFTPLTFEWDVGIDGTSDAIGSNPNILFNDLGLGVGNHDVLLIVTDGNGFTRLDTSPLEILQATQPPNPNSSGIPEPTTATLGLIGMAGLMVRRRRAA